MKTLLAQTISRLSGPEAAMPLYFITLLILKGGLTREQMIHLIPTLLFLDWLVPLISLVVLIKLEKISDLEVTKRSERPLFLFIILLTLVGAVFFSYLWGNDLVFKLYLISLVLTLVLSGITLFYKISLHTAFNTFLLAVFNYLYIFKFGWVFSLLIPIAWSRWELKKHTLAQVAWGVIVGALVSLTGMSFLL